VSQSRWAFVWYRARLETRVRPRQRPLRVGAGPSRRVNKKAGLSAGQFSPKFESLFRTRLPIALARVARGVAVAASSRPASLRQGAPG